MTKIYCFGWKNGECIATLNADCYGCPFNKTTKQYGEDVGKAMERLRTLPYERQRYIADKYYDGSMFWNVKGGAQAAVQFILGDESNVKETGAADHEYGYAAPVQSEPELEYTRVRNDPTAQEAVGHVYRETEARLKHGVAEMYAKGRSVGSIAESLNISKECVAKYLFAISAEMARKAREVRKTNA